MTVVSVVDVCVFVFVLLADDGVFDVDVEVCDVVVRYGVVLDDVVVGYGVVLDDVVSGVMQAVFAVFSLYDPGGQGVHADAPCLLIVISGHAEHDVVDSA